MDNLLRIAVQKSGRLSEDSLDLIKSCGISWPKNKSRLVARSYNFPLELLFLRDDDIPQYVSDGVADVGIVGENEIAENEQEVEMVEHLGFSKCRLSIAVPKEMDFGNIHHLDGMSIATSYPNILKNYLSENTINADVHEISGSVEIAPGIGLAGAICDIVSSGSTLLSNGLKEVAKVMDSEAVLIANPGLSAEKQALLDQLSFRIRSVKRAGQYKYVLMNVPNASINSVTRLIPGMKSPTVLPLGIEGWSSLHSVVKEKEFWGVIDELRQIGAEGILVIPIEKMIL
ncbi:MAG: ATP phosphoribosyltransferase [Bacteroidota bacterium]